MTKPVFINTRPATRTSDLPAVAKIADIVHLPLLELVPRPLDESERQFLNRLTRGDYGVLVVVSITAVECAMAVLDKDMINKIKNLNRTGRLAIVAVGATTAKALADVGLSAITPPTASNESMSTMAIFEKAKRVLFWRGVGGRTFLMDFLTAQGVAVETVDFYIRQPSADLSAQIATLTATLTANPIVLISSEMAYRSWQTLAQGLSCQFIALGERLGAMTGGAVVDDLNDETLANCIKNFN